MTVYIVRQGRGTTWTVWSSGDPGIPNCADTKEELLSFCPPPEGRICKQIGCSDEIPYRPVKKSSANWRQLTDAQRNWLTDNTISIPRAETWRWSLTWICVRCNRLRSVHHLEVSELIALWEAQGRKCYTGCGKVLNHPRATSNTDGRKDYLQNKGNIKIDHDHGICPQKEHSCKKCRRGLACHYCNTTILAERFVPWTIEAGGNPDYWLRLLGTDNPELAIGRLTDAITLLTKVLDADSKLSIDNKRTHFIKAGPRKGSGPVGKGAAILAAMNGDTDLVDLYMKQILSKKLAIEKVSEKKSR